MEFLKRKRTPLRASFTKVANELEEELKKDNPRDLTVHSLMKKLTSKDKRLMEADEDIMDKMQEDDAGDDEIITEHDGVEVYRDRMCDLSAKVESFHSKKRTEQVEEWETASGAVGKRKCKLPKIEWKTFSREVKDWLGFWGQFEKIHLDKEMDDADKFLYLLQAVEKGSRAAELVQSFPPSGKCYPKAIECLKNRFGKEEILVEVYVRELLRLVLHNAVNPKTKIVLSSLYDKLETQLRALETLGVTSDKYASMLYPLVESCLPEEILRAWKRSKLLGREGSTQNTEENQNKLTSLMAFLHNEVENEESINLAREGFSIEKPKKVKAKVEFSEDVPTAAGLFNGNSSDKKSEKSSCIFCGKGNHESQNCYKAEKMSLEDKRKISQEKNCCFRCIKQGHPAKFCKEKIKCKKCSKSHYEVMCPGLPVQKEKESKSEQSDKPENKETTALSNQTCTSDVLLQTIRVILFNGNREKIIRAVIDGGSQRSYISKEAAKAMGYQDNGEVRIRHSLFGGVQTKEKIHQRYQIRVSSLDRKYRCTFNTLDEVKICELIPKVQNGPWLSELKKSGITLTDVECGNLNIDLLIGADVSGKLNTGRMKILTSGLVALETHLGWTLSGEVPGTESRNDSTLMVTSLFVKDADIQKLWQLDTIGITDPAESKSQEELQQAAVEYFNKTVKVDSEGRYEVSLPFVVGHDGHQLPDNRRLTEKRMGSVTKKLKANDFMKKYQQAFKEWLDEEIIEEVPENELEKFGHYLPHRAVVKDEGTTKVRPVFDASAREKSSPSLNDCLEKGPNLLELIPTILTRFRMKRIGVLSDIRKAYLQISIREEERDFLRFFLWKDFDEDTAAEKVKDNTTKENCMSQKENCNYKVFRHRRVVFGVSCSAFLLGATINYHLDGAPQSLQESAQKLKSSFYIDNCVASLNSEDELQKFIKESTEIMKAGKFDLRNWEWTGKETEEESNVIPVLGLSWDLKEDTLRCDVRIDYEEYDTIVTKRKILEAAHKVFDPIGFSSPVTLLPKLLLQKAWSLKVGWDEALPEDITKKFLEWRNFIPNLEEVKFPRWMFKENIAREFWSLHVFVDASKEAYAACVFLRAESEAGISTQLVLAKNKVAPVKTVTIPRLELLACLIGTRLADTVKRILNYADIPTWYWTDSSNALCWIRKEEKWETFVGNRVNEILKSTKKEMWNHVPGVLNPANLPSRGCSVEQLLNSSWWEGPAWLKRPMEFWPKSKITPDNVIVDAEKAKTVLAANNLAINKKNFSERLMENAAHYEDLIRKVGWMQRFIQNCLRKKKNEELVKCGLKVNELEAAEKNVSRIIQRESVKYNPDILKGIRTFEDDENLLRVKTKITRRDDSVNFVTPIILSPCHPIVKLLVKAKHEELSHAGIQVLLCALREKHWIVRARKLIRSVIRDCTKCKRFDVPHLEAQPAPLPLDRVRNAAVFEVTGIDLAGPLHLKGGSKAWIVVFTCAVYRAVHLECVTSLSTDAFLQAFFRFIARRGRPTIVYSDNGTNFVGADNMFKAIDWKSIEMYADVRRIQWKFIPPTAAWWGGFWKRIVQMVKKILRRVLGRASLSYEELTTILCDSEAVINGRPLTYVLEATEDLVPLTPAMFLQEVEEVGVPDLDSLDAKALNKRFAYRQKLKDDLRKRFREEYLGMLLQPGKKVKTARSVNPGDIVLVGADGMKRLDWILGKVVDLIPGSDGIVRVAKLKTAKGFITRPIQRLYPMEIKEKVFEPDLAEEDSAGEKVVFTRSGRKIKAPDRLGY